MILRKLSEGIFGEVFAAAAVSYHLRSLLFEMGASYYA
jgi:hypothetical protein